MRTTGLTVTVMALLCRRVNCLATTRRLLVLNTIVMIVNLLILTAIFHPRWQGHLSYFERVITPAQRVTMMTTLRALVRQMEANNLTYFMMSGTLIGSVRHHDMIPWDDDIDIGFLSVEKERIRSVLRALEPDFVLYIRHDDLTDKEPWKFFPRTSGGYIHMSWRWPYIDMFFYGENETHTWNERPVETQQIFRKCDVFPVRMRPFGAMMLAAPCDPLAVLRSEFGDIDRCISRTFSHILEIPMPFMSRELPCAELAQQYRFVSRTYNGTRVHEKLAIGQVTINEVSLPAACPHPCAGVTV